MGVTRTIRVHGCIDQAQLTPIINYFGCIERRYIMKVAEQISLLMSGKVTYDQLKELKAEELAEKNEPPQENETETEETETETKETETETKETETEKPVKNKELEDALAQVEALTKQVEELQKKNTQKDIEGKAGGEAFDMSEFVKQFKG